MPRAENVLYFKVKKNYKEIYADKQTDKTFFAEICWG